MSLHATSSHEATRYFMNLPAKHAGALVCPRTRALSGETWLTAIGCQTQTDQGVCHLNRESFPYQSSGAAASALSGAVLPCTAECGFGVRSANVAGAQLGTTCPGHATAACAVLGFHTPQVHRPLIAAPPLK